MALGALFVFKVEAVINATVTGLNEDVYTVSFSGSGNTIVTVYKVELLGSTTDQQIVDIFNALVAAAIDDTLIAGRTVIAGSVFFANSEFGGGHHHQNSALLQHGASAYLSLLVSVYRKILKQVAA